MFASAKNLLLKFHIKQVSYESSITQRKIGSKYPSSSKQTRTCSKRLQMKVAHSVEKQLYRSIWSARCFPAVFSRHLWKKITCFVNFDNLIGQLLCLPQYHRLRRRSAKRYLWDTESVEDQAISSLVQRGDRPSMPPTDYQEEKGAFQLTINYFLWSTHYIMFVKGNISRNTSVYSVMSVMQWDQYLTMAPQITALAAWLCSAIDITGLDIGYRGVWCLFA